MTKRFLHVFLRHSFRNSAKKKKAIVHRLNNVIGQDRFFGLLETNLRISFKALYERKFF